MNSDLSNFKKGSVVSCRFPLAESPQEPGPILRPALVIQVFFDSIDKIWKAAVAYGTSRRTRANAGFEIRLTQQGGLQLAGLDRPTRFTLSRMRILPINEEFFDLSGETPALGYLDDGLIQRLNDTLKILSEIADPLRPLLKIPDNAIPVLEVVSRNYIQAPSDTSSAHLASHSVDEFMQEHMTGRASLNGMNKPTRKSA